MKVRLKVFIVFAAASGFTAVLRFLLTVIGFPIGNWFGLAFVCSLPGALVTLVLLRAKSDPDAWRISAGFVVVLVVLLGAPWCSRDYFLADFYRVQPGMAEGQVEAILGKYLKGERYLDTLPARTLEAGEAAPPNADAPLCQSYQHSRDAAWNADWGTVCYRGGAVVSATFVPD